MISRFFGLCLLVGCLAVVYFFEGESSASGALRLFHWPAMVLTGVGPFAMTLLSFDWAVLFRALKWVFSRGVESRQKKQDREALMLHRLSKQYYESGPAAFEGAKLPGASPHIRKVVDRLAIKIPHQDIRDMLRLERNRFESRLHQCTNVMALGLRLAPSLGMLGTILGMVRLLSTLEDPSRIGSQMSLALLTTFYGLFFSIVLWTPLQQKLERLMDIELEAFDKTLTWLELLEKRKPSAYFADSAEIPDYAARERKAA